MLNLLRLLVISRKESLKVLLSTKTSLLSWKTMN